MKLLMQISFCYFFPHLLIEIKGRIWYYEGGSHKPVCAGHEAAHMRLLLSTAAAARMPPVCGSTLCLGKKFRRNPL